jgi:hypothetical protein
MNTASAAFTAPERLLGEFQPPGARIGGDQLV